MGEIVRRSVVLSFACAMLAVWALAGCATSITIQAQRTPALNTAGIKRIAIMPFESANGDAVYKSAARYATNAATGKIQATNHFTLVSPSVINDARKRGEGIENYVDALFTGQITRISEKITPHQSQYKKKDTGETVTNTYYVKEVELDLSYSLVRARDGTIIGPVARKGSSSDNQENVDNFASADTLASRIIDSQLRLLHQDIVPYTVRINRTLEIEKNKELKPQMKAALAYVKGSNYMAARQAYIDIWEFYSSVAAAVNAAILYEAMGETRNAADFMQQVLFETGSPLASSALARLNRELAEQAGVEQFAKTRSPAEKAMDHAISEVQKVIPPEAKLWIHSIAKNNQHMAANVIDNMTSALVNRGVTVVERQMIDMVLREQNFQLEGNVSDDDFVSIGNLAGANTIVIVGITGAGAERRLQVRVLDIRAGTVIMQSGTGSEWYL